MKKTIILSVLIVVVMGCESYHVKVSDDQFKKSKVLKVEMWHKVLEGNLDNRSAVYIREIKDGKNQPITVNFHFRAGDLMRSAMMSPFGTTNRTVELDEEAYILIDDVSNKLPVTNRQLDRTMTVWSGSGAIYGGTHDDLYGTLELSSDIAKKISRAKNIQYRFYAKGEPTTLEATPKQLESLKEFVSNAPLQKN